MEHLQRMWHASRECLLFRKPGYVPLFWSCFCSNSWDQFFRTFRVFSRLFTLKTPRYFLDFAFNMFDEWSFVQCISSFVFYFIVLYCVMYYVIVGLGFFSTIVTLKLFHQPKGGKRRVQVNNLWENIDILRTGISMYCLWTKILHILLYHCSRICRFPMSYIFLQNLFADNPFRVKTEFAGNTNRRRDNIFQVISFGKTHI